MERPECATSGLWSIDSDTVGGKTLLSALLVAYTAGKEVTVRSFHDINCDNRDDMADVKQIDFAG